MKETIQQVLNVITPIPEDKWSIGPTDGDKCCFYRHLHLHQSLLVDQICQIGLDNKVYFGMINDGNDLNYQQDTPKQRVLAALNDLLI